MHWCQVVALIYTSALNRIYRLCIIPLAHGSAIFRNLVFLNFTFIPVVIAHFKAVLLLELI